MQSLQARRRLPTRGMHSGAVVVISIELLWDADEV